MLRYIVEEEHYLSYVTLFASFNTRHRSGRSTSSSDGSTAMIMRVSDTFENCQAESIKIIEMAVTLYTTPSAAFGLVAASSGFLILVAFLEGPDDDVFSSIRARSPGLLDS